MIKDTRNIVDGSPDVCKNNRPAENRTEWASATTMLILRGLVCCLLWHGFLCHNLLRRKTEVDVFLIENRVPIKKKHLLWLVLPSQSFQAHKKESCRQAVWEPLTHVHTAWSCWDDCVMCWYEGHVPMLHIRLILPVRLWRGHIVWLRPFRDRRKQNWNIN